MQHNFITEDEQKHQTENVVVTEAIIFCLSVFSFLNFFLKPWLTGPVYSKSDRVPKETPQNKVRGRRPNVIPKKKNEARV